MTPIKASSRRPRTTVVHLIDQVLLAQNCSSVHCCAHAQRALLSHDPAAPDPETTLLVGVPTHTHCDHGPTHASARNPGGGGRPAPFPPFPGCILPPESAHKPEWAPP